MCGASNDTSCRSTLLEIHVGVAVLVTKPIAKLAPRPQQGTPLMISLTCVEVAVIHLKLSERPEPFAAAQG